MDHLIRMEQMQDYIQSSITELLSLWTEIGLDFQEQQEKIGGLFQECHNVFSKSLVEQRQAIDCLNERIRELKESSVVLTQELQIEWKEPETGSSLRQRLQQWEDYYRNLSNQREERRKILMEVQTQLSDLSQRLCEPVDPCFTEISHDSSENFIWKVQQQVVALKKREEERRENISRLLGECSELIIELGTSNVSLLDQQIMAEEKSFLPTLETLEVLSARLNELKNEKDERLKYLVQIGTQIDQLWNLLKVDENIRTSFYDSMNGIGNDAIQLAQNELERLLVLKREKLSSLIFECRHHIIDLWDKMEYPSELRYFEAMSITPELFSDEVYTAHEAELRKLQARYDAMQPLLKYIDLREDIIEERTRYEESLKDPFRLVKKNGRRDTGLLLREEKIQIRIKKDLPKVTESLKNKIRLWEADHDSAFFYKGERYIEYMEKVDNEYLAKKQMEKEEKERRRRSGRNSESHPAVTPREKKHTNRSSVLTLSAKSLKTSISSKESDTVSVSTTSTHSEAA